MATPAMRVQNIAATVYSGIPGSFRCNTFNEDGSALDVSSGYTLQALAGLPASNANYYGAASVLTSDVTATFDTTGVTISWTGAQAATIAGAVQSANNLCKLTLTNDGGTTKALAAKVNLAVEILNGLL